jgi:predicted adenine nucleotide alpha hydrolase (AANH) superfamily ATPase
MEKLTLAQLESKTDWNNAVIVFTNDSFKKEYPENSRSYQISHENKWFKSNMIGCSLFGNCLDGTDNGVRLDWYIKEGSPKWRVEYCYITD